MLQIFTKSVKLQGKKYSLDLYFETVIKILTQNSQFQGQITQPKQFHVRSFDKVTWSSTHF